MANFESGYTTGLIGIGFDASLYAALKLDGGGAGSMVHIAKGGGGGNQLAWAYPGIYDVKARISNTVVKYGLQAVDNRSWSSTTTVRCRRRSSVRRSSAMNSRT